MTKNLNTKAFESGSYLFVARMFDKFSSILTIVILARLLDPEEFGLIALALVVVTLIESFTAISLESALIQRTEINDDDLNVAWTYGRVVRSIGLVILVVVSSPYIANFFGEPRLALILQVMMIGQIFKGIENIGMTLYMKELDFQKDFILTMYSRIVRILVLIVSAYYFRNVWAFVLAYLALNITSVLLSYYLHPYRPRLNFNPQVFKSLFDFGGWVFFSQLIRSLYSTMDRSFIGRMMTATFLGYYHIAHRFGNEIPNELKSVVNQVMFPLFSIQKDNIEIVKENFLLLLKINLICIFPILSIIFFMSDYLVILFLGEGWELAISSLKILILAASIQSLISSAFPLFKGLGYPHYETRILLTNVLFTLVTIYPLVLNYGIEGAALSLLIGQFMALPYFLHLIKQFKINFLDITHALLKPLLISILLSLQIFLFKAWNFYIINWSVFIEILISLIIFSVIIFIFLLKINKDKDIIKIYSFISSYLRSKHI